MPDGFRNPVIPGFHPDPSVCRVGDDYYLVSSSFTYFPGVPIFHSRDLVTWAQIGNVLDRPSQLDLSGSAGWSSLGIFAPTLRHHDGRFWMITSNVLDLFFVTADDPAGPWSDPVRLVPPGIDPDLAWDDDGTCWLSFSAAGIKRCRIDDCTGALLDDPVETWSGSGLQYPEAPHLYRVGDLWYLMIAEGGTERGHAVSVARGPSAEGPWEPCPANPILSHRSSDHPIQSTGHGDLVEAADGSWWMVALGTRPSGTTPGYHVLGRETFLASVAWVDGWPVVGPLELEMPRRPPGEALAVVDEVRDGFDDEALHPRWVSVRRPLEEVCSLTARRGWLTVLRTEATLDDATPAFVGRCQQHHACRASTLVEAEGAAEAGLVVRMDELAHYSVSVRGDEVVARARIGPVSQVVGSAPRPSGPVELVIRTDPSDAMVPDNVMLGFLDGDGEEQILAALDGRYLSTEVASGFIGRVIGMYAVGGHAAFDRFDYEALP
jgi:xylan 1,4-beta-xylosidase